MHSRTQHSLMQLRWLAVVAVAFIGACTPTPSGQITILHTNDIHCNFLPVVATWVDGQPKPNIGGMEALNYFVQRERARNPRSILLDAGDIMTGTPISNIEVEGARGGGLMQMMNMVGYDAMTIGNHEFDNGQENLRKLIDLAEFDVVSANLFTDGQLFAPLPYKIYKVGSLRVGVIGLILDGLSGVVAKHQLEGLRVASTIETAQKVIDEIDPKTDLIILLTHSGIEEDRELAQSIRGADVIVGGHSHTRISEPEELNGVIIAQAGSRCQYLGKLELTVEADTVSTFDGELISLWADSVRTRDNRMAELVDKYRNQIEAEYGVVIGTLSTDWRRSHFQESNIGNWLADAMREIAGTDFAAINSGGIRKNLKAGPIRKLDVVEILPFSNTLTTFECTGQELLTLLHNNAASSTFRNRGIVQISGIRCSYRKVADDIKIISASIGGKSIDPEKIYTGVTVDFVLYGQAKKYLGFEPSTPESVGIVLSDAIIDYIEKHPEVASSVEGRMRQIQ